MSAGKGGFAFLERHGVGSYHTELVSTLSSEGA